MVANIDMTNDRANIAFLGSRNDIWHRLGQEMQPGMSIDQWAQAAGLNWQAIKVPAIAALEGAEFDHIAPGERFRRVSERNFLVRSDNGYPLGYVSDRYQPVQPSELLAWFDRYIAVDDRFQLDVAGALYCGETVWATATFRDRLNVAGDAHLARVLMTTTFDGTGSTINQGTMTRVVCQNTLSMALANKASVIRTRHNTRFDAAKVGKELAAVAGGFARFKAMGDALAQVELSREQVGRFFKECLDIDPALQVRGADRDKVSSRKVNQLDELADAYRATARERGNEQGKLDAWTALNAITRYVDHDRTTRNNGVAAEEKQFTSANFGSGAAMKAKAWDLLMPMIKDKVPVAA